MPQRGYVIDSTVFAREGRRMKGEVEIGVLARLADELTDTGGSLQFGLLGELGAAGEHFLTLEIDGTLMLRCQRCLAQFVFPVSVRRRFVLLDSEQECPDEELADDEVDAIESEREMDLVALVEQEVLLALPLAPRHDICSAPGATDGGDDVRANTFGALGALKRVK
jgi:uncharacterized protein